MATKSEWAWFAGLYEGEGSVVASLKNHQTHLTITSTDRDVLERARKIAGCGNINTWVPEQRNWRTRYTLTITRRDDVFYLLEKMRPWLGRRRTEQADKVIELRTRLRLNCIICGKEFERRAARAITCSSACSEKRRRLYVQYGLGYKAECGEKISAPRKAR